ncbi:uncharacterized protein M6B38_350555 [Iris pallida]|uniref:Uncharacterized protein n=1 Tax=Iris pallida TaxID=29817 RepID=A0AAX6GQT8_IRIPA|nr:uncharacterized protein M6B38_350555 [Iris pallida]
MGKGVPTVSSCGASDLRPRRWAPDRRHSGSRESSPALALARRRAAGLALIGCWRSCEEGAERSSGKMGSRARTAWKGGRHGKSLHGVGSETLPRLWRTGSTLGGLARTPRSRGRSRPLRRGAPGAAVRVSSTESTRLIGGKVWRGMAAGEAGAARSRLSSVGSGQGVPRWNRAEARGR